MDLPPLLGFTVGVTAGRRAEEQGRLLERKGARVRYGATMTSDAPDDEDALIASTRAVVAAPPAVVLLTTGVGLKAWLAHADETGDGDDLRAVLAGTEILCRGPKAAGVAVATGLTVAWKAPGERSHELLERLDARPDRSGLRVAVQLDGHESSWLADEVAARGCDVVAVRPYRWRLPDDPTPALQLVEAARDGEVDALTFTSAPSVHNLFRLAEDAGLDDALRDAFTGRVLAVCVGPVSAGAVAQHGVTAVEPERARTPAMVAALCDELAARRRTLALAGHEVTLSGSVAVVDGDPVDISPRERQLFEALAERPGAVFSKTALLARAWPGSGADAHAVEAAVARLRQRLGPAGKGVETVVRRGYRLAVA